MTTVPMLDLRREYDYMKDSIDRAIAACLIHQKWILGPEVKQFEDEVAQYLGVKHCVGVSSGTDALVLALRALAIKLKGREYFDKSDEIITTPLTFTATGDAILRAGATPVFVDIDPASYNIDPVRIQEYLALSNAQQLDRSTRVVGVIPVHLYGRPCEMDRILELASQYGLFVLEDTAQAFGGSWRGSKLGSIGTCGAFSFFPSKNLGSFGDAGMVCTMDDEIMHLVRELTKHGGRDKYNVEHIGYNGRLDTLQAAILLAKLKYVDDFNERRRLLAEVYTTGLGHIAEIALPDHNLCQVQQETLSVPLPQPRHVYHQYTIGVEPGRRDKLREALHENGVSSMIYYPFPLHKMEVFRGGRSKLGTSLLHAEKASSCVLSLPMEPLQSPEETAYVCEHVSRFFAKRG